MNRVYWVGLALTGQIGGKTITRLLQYFGSLEAIFEADAEALMRVPQIGPKTAQAIISIDLDMIESEMAGYKAQGIDILTWEDPVFPPNLILAHDAPPVLFMRGEVQPIDSRAIAVVGMRQPSPASMELAQELSGALASRGWTIISGLALGIDTAAHRGALEAGGRSIGVLGSGVAQVYPPGNIALAEEICQQGALLSELSPDARVARQSLLARNRITSGLSRAVIVVESGKNGGSISTARLAQKQRRPVFACEMDSGGRDQLENLGAVFLRAADLADGDGLSARFDAIPLEPSRRDPPQQAPLF